MSVDTVADEILQQAMILHETLASRGMHPTYVGQWNSQGSIRTAVFALTDEGGNHLSYDEALFCNDPADYQQKTRRIHDIGFPLVDIFIESREILRHPARAPRLFAVLSQLKPKQLPYRMQLGRELQFPL